jgi:hypothetical protein
MSNKMKKNKAKATAVPVQPSLAEDISNATEEALQDRLWLLANNEVGEMALVISICLWRCQTLAG